jgi:hypothetical protein
MPDPADDHRPTAEALRDYWSSRGRSMSVELEGSWIVAADHRVRSRLIAVHLVIHDTLRGDPGSARAALSAMEDSMTAFCALRSISLADELIEASDRSSWSAVRSAARRSLPALLDSADAPRWECAVELDTAIEADQVRPTRRRIVETIAAVAAAHPHPAWRGVAAYGVAVGVEALVSTGSGSRDEVIAEHGALVLLTANVETAEGHAGDGGS